MIHSNVSCVVDKTLKRFQELKLDKMITTDYYGFITITKERKVLIDGEIFFKDFDNELIIKLLMRKSNEIYQLEKGHILEFNKDSKIISMLITPIRYQEKYKVFSISCSFENKYNERDLWINNFVTKVYYENVLLNSEIIKERDYLNNLFNSTDLFVIGVDTGGKITSINKGANEILGPDCESIIGKNYGTIICERHTQIVDKLVKNVIMENKSYKKSGCILINSNKKKVIVSLTISPIHNHIGEVVGAVIIGNDITKLKIYERELEQLRQFANVGELVTSTAHEIRNPLMNIRGCAKILERNLKNDPIQLEFIEPIISQVDRLNEIIKNMLSYSFIIKEESYSYISINEVLEKCYNVISLHKNSKHIVIKKKFSKNLPLVKYKNVQLQQAIINILFNSIEAIESEGEINIESYNLENEKKVLICISDNGKGIKENKIDEIFDPFYTTKDKSTGIGLAIAERFIREQGGEIKVSSSIKERTKFDIYLPY